jgi:hydrogenase-4 component E
MVINLLLASTILINFLLVATGRAGQMVRHAAIQGAILGLILLLLHEKWPPHVLLMAGSTIAIKGAVIPWLLTQALSRTKDLHGSAPRPYVGYTLSLALLAGGTFLAFLLAKDLPLQVGALGTLFIPASLATLFTGFLLLTTRRRALLQVVGYLVLENGVFLFSLLLVRSMPLLVESGVLLDLVVGIFVMAIVINHIQHIYDSQDTKRMSHLKE